MLKIQLCHHRNKLHIKNILKQKTVILNKCSFVNHVMCFLQVNPQLYSTREKQQLYDLIDTMINYSLTYRQDRTPEGQYTYVLEPWVHAHTQTTLPWSTDSFNILFCRHFSYATQTSSQEYTITHTALRDSVCVYLFITIHERLGCICRLLSLPPLFFPFFYYSPSSVSLWRFSQMRTLLLAWCMDAHIHHSSI